MKLHLPHIPERTTKPRENGVNMIMDKALSTREAEDMVSVSGDYVDLVKLGFGTSYFTNNNKEKVKIYQAAGMDVYLGGTLFEACYVRGKLDEYLKFIDDLGINTLEVSDGSIVLPHDEKLELISTLAKNYKVLSEVGSKEEGILIAPAKWISMMQTELEAGSWKVIAEARESGNVGIYRPNGSAHTMLVNKILAKVDGDKILWEAPKKTQQVWFIKLLGHNVNLGNIAPNDVIPLETLRAGLRGDTFFSWLPEDIVNVRAPK
jgi:phosphosulfolactate synthase